MTKFRVTTDTGCDLPAALCREQEIGLLNTASVPLPEDYLAFWRPLFAADPRPVLHLCMSSALSGAYYNGVMAVELLHDEFPDAPVWVMDSRQASAGYGMLALAAVAMARQGEEASACARQLETLRFSVNSYSAQFNSPELLALDAGGHLRKETLPARSGDGIARLCRRVVARAVTPEGHTLFIGHREAPEGAVMLGEALRDQCGFRAVQYVSLSGMAGIPAGQLAAFFYGQPRV